MKQLFTYLFLIVVGIVIYKVHLKDIWDWWGAIDTSSAVALAMLAGWAYYEYQKGENVIKIYFQTKDKNGNLKKIDTKLSILRKEFSRAELNGLLGMIQKNQKERFEIASLKNPKILQQIQDIQTGKLNECVIELKDDEIEQFYIEGNNGN